MERRLAAILAADVVGYSALMESDEAGTFERLKAHRTEIFEPEVKLHHGRIFKLMGDGLLAEFGSVVDAVECAVAVQKAMARRNDGLAPEKRIDIRIGVNLGDVIIEGEDRHGEGVNIAARLEQLADPGGICVSQTVIDHLSNKLPIGFDAMGEHQVKNIAKPVAVYRARLDGAPVKQAAPAAAKPPWHWAAAVLAVVLLAAGAWYALSPQAPETVAATDGKPSLVVLPFANLSDDKEQGYLADGITEDLTTELARVPGLFVISRNAALTYKGKAMQPAQIAKELGVRYILEGSTRRAGEEMRINAQLIDTQTGGHLWAERFDGQWADVFALQDKVIENVADALKLRLVTGDGKAQIAGGTNHPAAYEAFLRGLELELRNTPAEIAKAVTLYEQALALDPNFGRATAQLAWVYWNADEPRAKALGGLSWDEVSAKRDGFLAAAAQHPSPNYYQISAQLLTQEWKSDEAIAGLQKALALDPSDPGTFDGLSQALIFNGRPKEARAYLDAAMRLDPGGSADWRHFLAGLAAFGQNRFEDAAAALEKIDLRSPDPWTKFYGLQVLIASYGHLGRGAEIATAKSSLDAALKDAGEGPSYNMQITQVYFVYKNEADIVRLLDGLAKAGIPELPPDVDPQWKDRLTGAEIKSLILGHELRGRKIAPDVADYSVVYTADGKAAVTIGLWSNTGTVWVQGNSRCLAYPSNLTTCGAVFRNPWGTYEQRNEYWQVFRRNRFEFSVVK